MDAAAVPAGAAPAEGSPAGGGSDPDRASPAEAKHTDADTDALAARSWRSAKRQAKEHRSPEQKMRRAASWRRHVDKSHPWFELTWDMMLGMRTTVGRMEARPAREPVDADFDAAIRLYFLSEGTLDTPAHDKRDFKFKDYCPEACQRAGAAPARAAAAECVAIAQVFRHLRALFHLNPVNYIMSVCGNFEYLEFVANAKGGQFFFFTYDQLAMIKTLSQQDTRCLCSMLRQYYAVCTCAGPSACLQLARVW
jgi:1-phosphatidylinositol-4-phosphate 5-kinase